MVTKKLNKKKKLLGNIKSLVPKDIKINLANPIEVIENTKDKIDTYISNYKKDREKEKKLEKKRKLDKKTRRKRKKKLKRKN